MATPIQVVLQAKNFIRAFERPPGGSRKDIYKDRDKDFRAHRDKLASQVKGLASSDQVFGRSGVAVASVELAHDALAKSNRPAGLLNPKRLPPLGTARAAELLVQVTPGALRDLSDRIANAPIQLNVREKVDVDTGEVTVEEKPATVRCDVGAIENINFWDAARRQRMSNEQIGKWFEQGGVSLNLIVQLFDFEAPFADSARANLEDLRAALRRYGCDCTIRVIGEKLHRSRFLIVGFGADPDNWQHALEQALGELSENYLVRTISVPARVTESASAKPAGAAGGRRRSIPERNAQKKYPVVGVVDGGIGKALSGWVTAKHSIISDAHGEEDHGTYIGGILVAGQTLNSQSISPEPDGCDLVDICIMPREGDRHLFRRYFKNTDQFFNELDASVKRAREESGARVFNFSINFETPLADGDEYRYETRKLDEIARKYDVVFVIPSGNLLAGRYRTEWPEGDIPALSALAAHSGDRLLGPADSIANVSVAALNPPGVVDYLPGVPAAYSRRGPSPFGGVKPDFAHFGGCAVEAGVKSGIRSVGSDGRLVSKFGTSYAVPLVAKTLAMYPLSIENDLSREMMIALLVHHARIPSKLQSPNFDSITRDLVGFGVPSEADATLAGNSHSVTIVFEERIPRGQRLEFDFDWPRSLTSGGKCRGLGKLTLVSRPEMDLKSGHEVVRTQLDGHAYQLDGQGKKKGGHFHISNMPKALVGKKKVKESDLIRHALKWSPIKSYRFKAPNGQGESSRWRMTVETLERSPGEIPEEGIPFVAILTIEDLDAKAPVFADMQRSFTRMGIRTQDIRSKAQARGAART